jgi:ACS family tartrate transporter-like MFS transporter
MLDVGNTTAATLAVPDERAVFRKVALRLIPFLFLLYVVNLIDRTNIGIARLQMVDKQHILDEEAYALGAGLFYVGYLLFEVPSNLILLRMGARAWMARILVSWGLISSAMMFVYDAWSFAILRVLLGVAEAGFFPGIIFYLNGWFPSRVRGRAIAWFMIGGVIASLVGNPISGFILQYMDTVGGLWGWQWVFLLEGLPAMILGFITLMYLTDHPEQAHWLTLTERTWLVEQIQTDHAESSSENAPATTGGELRGEEADRSKRLPGPSADSQHPVALAPQYQERPAFRAVSPPPDRRMHSLWAACCDPRVWLLIAIYFTVAMGDNSYGFYIPTFLKSQFPGWEPFQIGLLTTIPSVIALVAMVLVGRSSDRARERRWHVAGSAFTAALGWLTIALVASGALTIPGLDSRWLFVAGVTLTLTGMKCMLPTFWTLPPTFLTGAAAAGGIALINSVANLGGLFGPAMVGRVKTVTGSFTVGYLVLAAVLFVGGLLVFTVTSRKGDASS